MCLSYIFHFVCRKKRLVKPEHNLKSLEYICSERPVIYMKKALQCSSKKLAAIYVRVSTDEQAREGLSIDAQIETLTQYCRLYGLEIYNIYKDLGISGKSTANRPGLKLLLSDASDGRFNTVLVWKISRMTRSLKDLLDIVDTLEMLGVDFVSCSERLDTSTSVGRMTLQLIGSIAEFERNNIIENVKLGLEEFARKGGKSTTVLGYDNYNRALIVNDKEATIVQMIYDSYDNGNRSLSQIAKELNAQGLKTKRGMYFRSDSITTILRNPVYIGINRHQRNSPKEYCIEGKHEPIISEELWRSVQKKLDENSYKRSSLRSNSSLLRGLVFCPVCKSSMNIFYISSKKKNYRYYRCSSTSCCFMVNADKLEDAIYNLVFMIINNASFKEDLLNMTSEYCSLKHTRINNRLEILELDISNQQRLLDKYISLFENNKLQPTEHLIERIGLIEEQLKLLENQKSEASKENEEKNDYGLADYLNSIGLDELFKTMDEKDRRRLYMEIIEKIDIAADNKSIKLCYTLPMLEA